MEKAESFRGKRPSQPAGRTAPLLGVVRDDGQVVLSAGAEDWMRRKGILPAR